MSYCFLIPCFNHGKTLRSTLEYLQAFGLAVLVIDDGSEAENAALIKDTCNDFDFADLHVKENNSGKGGAVITGMLLASKKGFSHVVQIDSDGQHNIEDAHHLIAKSQENPKALIGGRPIYDESIPKHRYYARYLTHVWVWIETLSFSIPDSMCGFRVYPVDACEKLLSKTKIGKYMDFDGEIIVRLYWQGIPMIFMPTKVIYPEDGSSNFRALQDNVLISWMHTRLFFGMLIRSPKLILRKLSSARIEK